MDEAISQFRKALQIKPDFAEAHFKLGDALLQKENVKEAFLHYEEAQQLERANPAVKNNLAWLLATCPEASLRNGSKALELARQAKTVFRQPPPSSCGFTNAVSNVHCTFGGTIPWMDFSTSMSSVVCMGTGSLSVPFCAALTGCRSRGSAPSAVAPTRAAAS